MQGKRQSIGKINRKDKVQGRHVSRARACPSSTSFGRESLGWRQGCSEAASVICSPGGRKRAPDECSDWARMPTTRLFGVEGHPCSLVVFHNSIIPGSKGSQNQILYEKF